MAKGVLWVSSRVVEPSKLSSEKFCDWYENTHIQEVLALAGVPSAKRYAALRPQPPWPQPAWSDEALWLTVYDMPDVGFKESKEFKSLAGQSPPSRELIEEIFKCARFDTRFYEEVGRKEVGEGDEVNQPRVLISITFSSPSDPSTCLSPLSSLPTFQRIRWYSLFSSDSNATILERFERQTALPASHLALIEFQNEKVDWAKFKEVVEGLGCEEVGYYVVKREYEESEWGMVGVEK